MIKNNLLVAGLPVVNTPMLGALMRAEIPLELDVIERIVGKKFVKRVRRMLGL